MVRVREVVFWAGTRVIIANFLFFELLSSCLVIKLQNELYLSSAFLFGLRHFD